MPLSMPIQSHHMDRSTILQIHCKLPRRLHIYKMLRLPRSKASPLKTPKHTWRKRPIGTEFRNSTTKACKSLWMLNATGGKHSSTPTPARWKREPFANGIWEKPPKPPDIEVGRSMVIICGRVFIGIPWYSIKPRLGLKLCICINFLPLLSWNFVAPELEYTFNLVTFQNDFAETILIGVASSNQGASFWSQRSQVTSPVLSSSYDCFHKFSLSARVLFKRLNVSCERRLLKTILSVSAGESKMGVKKIIPANCFVSWVLIIRVWFLFILIASSSGRWNSVGLRLP